MLTFEPVETEQQIEELALMAAEIWGEYWPALIGKGQTDYMVQKFQTAAAIKDDMEHHAYRYWFLIDDQGTKVGYTGGATEIMTGNPEHDKEIMHNPTVQRRWNRRFFISKIYLYANQRGKHYSSRVLDFYEKLCKDEHLQVMYLTVNKGNTLGIRAYLGNGFKIVDMQAADIGGGYVMDDNIMAKEIQ